MSHHNRQGQQQTAARGHDESAAASARCIADLKASLARAEQAGHTEEYLRLLRPTVREAIAEIRASGPSVCTCPTCGR